MTRTSPLGPSRPFLASIILLAGGLGLTCGQSPDASSGPIEVEAGGAEKVLEKARAAGEEVDHQEACHRLVEADLREVFELSRSVEIEWRPSSSGMVPHALCIASWRLLSDEEEKARMNDFVQRKMRGEEVAIPRSHAEVSLTLYRPKPASAEEAARTLESAMAVLNRGISTKVEVAGKEREASFQADTETIEGIGDEAHWIPRLSQVSFRDGREVLHLAVRATGEEGGNRALAERFAARLASD